ncbi:MAG: ABC transporter ATP-binding protein [Thermoplasmata archaeon]|nr:MAG: ABC transporter ATP-binding protein [Thermoplasmata archaeon]
MTGLPVIQVSSLVHRYGDFTALDGVTLKVPASSFFGFLGPNGAGKTTLVNILTGQMPPTAGRVRVLGLNPAEEPIELKRRIGIVPEEEIPPSFLTCQETLHFVAEVYGLDDPEGRALRWLDFFELSEKRDTLGKDLSKGMKQKLMLASALLPETNLLFLDEPFINLDPIFQRKVRDHLVNFVKGGKTIFMCTHMLDIAERICTHVAVIHKGKVLDRGTLAEVRAGGINLEELFFESVGMGAGTKGESR